MINLVSSDEAAGEYRYHSDAITQRDLLKDTVLFWEQFLRLIRRHRADGCPRALLETRSARVQWHLVQSVELAGQVRLEPELGLDVAVALALLLSRETPREMALDALPAVEEAQSHHLPLATRNPKLAHRRGVRGELDHRFARVCATPGLVHRYSAA